MCGLRATTTKMMAHVQTCVAAHDKIGQPQPLVVLRFAAVGDPRYWLVIEAEANAQLRHVDALLRQLWLECCGHLSAFEIGGVRYAVDAGMYDDWDMGEKSMRVRLEKVLSPGQTCSYEYDYDTMTELKLRVISEYEVETKGKAIQDCSRAMNRSCGHVAIAKPPRQWCVHTASIPTTGSSAMHMPRCTNMPARKSTFR